MPLMSASTAREKRHLHRRRVSPSKDAQKSPQRAYQRLPRSEDTLDTSTSSSRQALTTGLDFRISDFRTIESLKAKRKLMVRVWSDVASEALDTLRASVQSHFPNFLDTAVVKSHIPELLHSTLLRELCSRIPNFSLADISTRVDGVRPWFFDLDFRLLKELISELKEDADEPEVLFELAAQEVRDAVRRSFEGSRLIRYCHLPYQWRNNPYVTGGYRFIPIKSTLESQFSFLLKHVITQFHHTQSIFIPI